MSIFCRALHELRQVWQAEHVVLTVATHHGKICPALRPCRGQPQALLLLSCSLFACLNDENDSASIYSCLFDGELFLAIWYSMLPAHSQMHFRSCDAQVSFR